QMKFLILLALVAAAALAAPTATPDFADAESEFYQASEDEAPAAPKPAPERLAAAVTDAPAPEVLPTLPAFPGHPQFPAVEKAATEAPVITETEKAEEAAVPSEPETAPATEAPGVASVAPAADEEKEETNDENDKEDDKAAEENVTAPADDASSSSSDSETATDEPAVPSATDYSDSSESDEDEDTTTAALPAVAETEAPIHEIGASISTDAETPEQTAAATEQPTEQGAEEELPVATTATKTGSAATVSGVTVKFALQATWLVAGSRRRGYVVKITNNSDKDVCGVTFIPNTKTSDVWNLVVAGDGTFSTKDLHLAAGATANQFGYVSSARSTPTIVEVTFC
ncbi:hypothetical protein PFISCL1PPCAC_17316, partial [Pristionchus fissidentatus]